MASSEPMFLFQQLVLVLMMMFFCMQAFSTKVVDLTQYRDKKSCSEMLKSFPADHSAQILQFPDLVPPYIVSENFLKDYEASEVKDSYFYYLGDGAPPFSSTSDGQWNNLLEMPAGDTVYVLKLNWKENSIHIPNFQSNFQIRLLRKQAHLISFTKVRVSPIVKTVYHAIRFVRQMESQLNNVPYQTAKLSFKKLIHRSSPKFKAIDIVNSWETASEYEVEFKEFLKENLTQLLDPSAHPDTRKLESTLREKFLTLYKQSPF